MNAKIPECYTIDSQARCLRVEIMATRVLVLPLDQFVFAELDSADKEQKLRLVFATHEILISGYAMRRIEVALHRLELSGIMKLPQRFDLFIGDKEPRIQEIVVTECKSLVHP